MSAESAHGAHDVVATIQPAIALLGLGLVAALTAKALRLSPIVGYLALGALLAAFGQADNFSSPVVAAMAEAGVMFLLFNLGMHFSLTRIREEARNIFGFGSLQMAVAGGGFCLAGFALGLPPAAAIIGGFAMGLSSTAVVIGLIRERDQQDCPVGRAAQSILIFQDIAAIMLLVAAGALGTGGAMGPALAIAGVKAVAAFFVAVLFGRYLTEPLFGLIARARSSEVYTATALFLALAAGWATGIAGLSLTLGAFLGGVAIADSRHRVMVQTEIEAFRGLFLGFFFISVGLGIDPAILADKWPTIILTAIVLIVVKCALNIAAGLANQWSAPGSIQLGFLLGQGSEFALVLFSIPALAGLMGEELSAILVTAIAVSLAVTPAISNFGRTLAGKLRRGPADQKLSHEDDAPIVILGLGSTGRALADELQLASIKYVAVEADSRLFENAVADGYHVHHAMTDDPRTWDVLSMGQRQVVVVTGAKMSRVDELAPLAEERLPQVKRIITVDDQKHAPKIKQDGAIPVHVGGQDGTEALLDMVFEQLGRSRPAVTPRKAA
ncbi:cation:proton antiporter [Altererythrobacter sp. ZODW24]|uniref:cation:proton antiporter domain-containing protein n=1 Tax=Altererythrobacter sp. ZODW24 TaxID=2185142 RepID=UPI000DF7CBF9|nr:cation:proton antiporter [Altererythrobacter sp. ZODW24]